VAVGSELTVGATLAGVGMLLMVGVMVTAGRVGVVIGVEQPVRPSRHTTMIPAIFRMASV
jgi:methylglyoxal synthase